MEFKPSIVFDLEDNPIIVRDVPTITTNFSGNMRPLPNKTIEDLVQEIKDFILKKTREKESKKSI